MAVAKTAQTIGNPVGKLAAKQRAQDVAHGEHRQAARATAFSCQCRRSIAGTSRNTPRRARNRYARRSPWTSSSQDRAGTAPSAATDLRARGYGVHAGGGRGGREQTECTVGSARRGDAEIDAAPADAWSRPRPPAARRRATSATGRS